MRMRSEQELKDQIDQLPKGNLCFKMTGGKRRCYHQWTEDGCRHSKYVKPVDEPALRRAVERRKELERELAKLGGTVRPVRSSVRFVTDIKTGEALLNWAQQASGYEHRESFDRIMKYLRFRPEDRVLILYGLRRTGKTTMLRQAVLSMTEEERARTAYVKAKVGETLADVNHDLKELKRRGFKFVLIDEVTLMEDFIDGAALFSDVYCGEGMKVVLSGTDSLGFWCSVREALYDRAYLIHTSFISYREHARLLKIEDIDEYLRYGGMLQAGELAFEDEDALADDASFRDDESTRRYIDTAICRNIQHSLRCFEGGAHFRDLRELWRAGELTGAINRVIEDMNHEFVAEVLTRDFVSHDYGSAAQLLRSAKDPHRRTDVLDLLVRQKVTNRLMKILDIRNRESRNIAVTQVHADEIKEYLRALDLIASCTVRSAEKGAPDRERTVFTQPGMRFAQAQALVHALLSDGKFSARSRAEQDLVAQTILQDVAGRMLEDVVMYETQRWLKRSARASGREAFKLEFSDGEFDMVVWDREKGTCRLYEIKHAQERNSRQVRHLTDVRKLGQVARLYGRVEERTVLYRGEDIRLKNGIRYRNVNEYLCEEVGS